MTFIWFTSMCDIFDRIPVNLMIKIQNSCFLFSNTFLEQNDSIHNCVKSWDEKKGVKQLLGKHRDLTNDLNRNWLRQTWATHLECIINVVHSFFSFSLLFFCWLCFDCVFLDGPIQCHRPISYLRSIEC